MATNEQPRDGLRDQLEKDLLGVRKLPEYRDEKVWRQAVVGLATRCAARVFPFLGRHGHFVFLGEKDKFQRLLDVEAAWISSYCFSIGVMDNQDILRVAAAAAFDVAKDNSSAFVANAASFAAEAAIAGVSTTEAVAAACAVGLSTPEAATRVDIDLLQDGKRILGLPLWPDGVPKDLMEVYFRQWPKALKSIGLEEVGVRYKGMLAGNPDEKLMRQALSDWAKRRGLEDPFSTGKKTRSNSRSSSHEEVTEEPDSPERVERRVVLEGIPELATAEDHLGVKPYALALAGFICSEKTGAPMTISVEGNWGAGKSSFLKMVKVALEQDQKRVVWFNPWRHDVGEGLWAAFLVSFMDQVRSVMPFWERWWRDACFRARAIWKSLQERAGTWLLSVGSMIGLFLGRKWIVQSVDWTSERVLETVTLILPFAPLLWAIWKSWRGFTGTLKKDVERAWKRDDEIEKICMVERASEQFRSFLKSYTRKVKRPCEPSQGKDEGIKKPEWGSGRSEEKAEPIFVIIDDLDRCAAPKAVELLDSLQLLIAGNGDDEEEFPVVYLLGLDREKVAAGVAVKYERMLPYVGDGIDGEAGRRGEVGRSFGYEYLQKFIDVPFRIPTPGDENVKRFIDHLAAVEEPDTSGMDRAFNEEFRSEIGTIEREIDSGQSETEVRRVIDHQSRESDLEPGTEMNSRLDVLQGKAESRIEEVDLRNCLSMAAPLLGNNPRRIKQFKNLLTLRVFQGEETGLFDRGITVEMMAKVLLVELARPTLYRVMAEDLWLANDLAGAWNEDPDGGPESEVDGIDGTTCWERIESRLHKSDHEWVLGLAGYAKGKWDIASEEGSGFPEGDALKAILSLGAPVAAIELVVSLEEAEMSDDKTESAS